MGVQGKGRENDIIVSKSKMNNLKKMVLKIKYVKKIKDKSKFNMLRTPVSLSINII